MRLHSLHLQQFRNCSDRAIDFSGSDRHLLVGPNGAGKTNILESISVLSLGSSFLGAEEDDLMQWGTEFYRVRGMIRSDEGEDATVEAVSQRAPRRTKACFRNDVRVPVSSFVGLLPTVAFLPQDLELFTGAPSNRRRFLDLLLAQVDPQYNADLARYQKVLKHRASLLRAINEERGRAGDLAVWDDTLAETGGRITVARLELMETFGMTLGEEIRSLREQWEEVLLRYERKGEARALGDVQAELRELLRSHQDRDLLLQATTVGPHRDDWSVIADGHPFQSFASRGQQRTAVLALLFLEVSYLELRRNEKPVVLLDDVFSELDSAHQSCVLRSLADHQVLMTATHVPEGLEGVRLWEIGKDAVIAAV